MSKYREIQLAMSTRVYDDVSMYYLFTPSEKKRDHIDRFFNCRLILITTDRLSRVLHTPHLRSCLLNSRRVDSNDLQTYLNNDKYPLNTASAHTHTHAIVLQVGDLEKSKTGVNRDRNLSVQKTVWTTTGLKQSLDQPNSTLKNISPRYKHTTVLVLVGIELHE